MPQPGSALGPWLGVRALVCALVLVLTSWGIVGREQEGQPGTEAVGAQGAHAPSHHPSMPWLHSPRYNFPKLSKAFPAFHLFI